MNMGQHKQKSIIDFCELSKTRYFSLLISSKKWKELYNQNEAIISISIAFILACVFPYLIKEMSPEKITEIFSDVLLSLASALLSLLGIIISGLAIFTGTITNKLIKNIDSDQKSESIVNILYSFYFAAGIIGFSSLILIIHYFIVSLDLALNFPYMVGSIFILSYFCIFSILYSIALAGTCLRLFLVSYYYSDERRLLAQRKDLENYLEITFLDGTSKILVIDHELIEWYKFDTSLYKVLEEDNKEVIIIRTSILKIEIINNSFPIDRHKKDND